MSWFKRKATPVAEDLIEPVEEPQSDVQLAVDSLMSSGRFDGSALDFRETDGGFELRGLPTEDRDLWVAAVAFVETLTESELSRVLSSGAVLFVRERRG